MNITRAVDEHVAEQAGKAAFAVGKSLNQAVRDCLEQLASGSRLDLELLAFEQSALDTSGCLTGWISTATKPALADIGVGYLTRSFLVQASTP